MKLVRVPNNSSSSYLYSSRIYVQYLSGQLSKSLDEYRYDELELIGTLPNIGTGHVTLIFHHDAWCNKCLGWHLIFVKFCRSFITYIVRSSFERICLGICYLFYNCFKFYKNVHSTKQNDAIWKYTQALRYSQLNYVVFKNSFGNTQSGTQFE